MADPDLGRRTLGPEPKLVTSGDIQFEIQSAEGLSFVVQVSLRERVVVQPAYGKGKAESAGARIKCDFRQGLWAATTVETHRKSQKDHESTESVARYVIHGVESIRVDLLSVGADERRE